MIDDNEENLSDIRHIKAENAFSTYNFGGTVVSSQSWQEMGESWSKKLKIKYASPETSPAALSEEDKKEISFVVAFEHNSDAIVSVSAWDERTGQEVGYLKSPIRPLPPSI